MKVPEEPTQDIQEPESEFRLGDYWQIVWKWKWIVLAVFLIVVVTVTTKTYKLRPMYRATGRILIQSSRANYVSSEQGTIHEANTNGYFQTQYEIIRSRSVVGKVIEHLDLKNSPEFSGKKDKKTGLGFAQIKRKTIKFISTKIKQFRGDKDDKPNQTLSPKDFEPGLVQKELLYHRVASRISVSLVEESRLVDISMTGFHPQIITEIVNSIIKTYINKNLENRLFASEDAVEWLDSRLKTMQEKVEISEKALQEYSRTVGAISLESKLKLMNGELSNVNSQLTKARKERVILERLVGSFESPEIAESIPEIVTNKLVQELNLELSNLTLNESELKRRYGPKHPKLIQISSKIEKITESIDLQIKRIQESKRTELRLAIAAEESLEGALNEKQDEATFISEKSIRYRVLRRDAESNRNMFDLLLKRLKETDLSSGLRTNNIRLVDKAVPPLGPFKPDKQRNIMMGMVFGLLGGLGLAFFIEFLDNSVKEPDEIITRFGIPFLGLVGSHSVENRARAETSLHEKLITLKEPSSSISESLRTIRTNVIFSADGDKKKTLMVTSALPAEGKTTIASNLAIVMASLGEKVLLIDADLRRPSIHRMFNVPKSPGLSSHLINRKTLDEIIHKTTVENLFIIPSGIIPPNPSELLSHPQLQALLETATQSYNRVIVDTPPVASVADPMIISKVVDAVILVIRSRETARDVVSRAVNQLKNVNSDILGAILNDVDFRKDSYYYQYYYKHYYYKEDKNDQTA